MRTTHNTQTPWLRSLSQKIICDPAVLRAFSEGRTGVEVLENRCDRQARSARGNVLQISAIHPRHSSERATSHLHRTSQKHDIAYHPQVETFLNCFCGKLSTAQARGKQGNDRVVAAFSELSKQSERDLDRARPCRQVCSRIFLQLSLRPVSKISVRGNEGFAMHCQNEGVDGQCLASDWTHRLKACHVRKKA